jgi:hypothetical protein
MIGRASSALALSMVFLGSALAAGAEGPAASGRPPVVAILEIANAGMDPRVDYLASMVQGLLAFDIGSRKDLSLVDRRNLDAVLKEKELTLSALGQDADAAAEAGRLVGADWLLSGEYVFLGSDLLLTLSLTDASSAKRTVFRDRGGTENLVHKLAEQIVLRLTGTQPTFADPGRSRSLVSLRDETPGSIALYSPIIRAEVFVDEQFFAYTTGDSTLPLNIEKLSPGKHRLRVHLDSSFGVIKLPEVSFHDWEAEVDVESNKRLTVRDQTRHFNYSLSQLISIGGGKAKSLDSEASAASPAPKLAFVKELSFTDRKGVEIAVRVEAKPRLEGGALVLDLLLGAGPKGQAPASASASIVLASAESGSKEADVAAGIVNLNADLERRDGYWQLDWRVDRTDIEQNMFREQ